MTSTPSAKINEAISASIGAKLAEGGDFQIGKRDKTFKSAFNKFTDINPNWAFNRSQNAKALAQIQMHFLKANGLAKLSYVNERRNSRANVKAKGPKAKPATPATPASPNTPPNKGRN